MARFYVKKDSWLPRIAELCRQSGSIGIDTETARQPAWAHDERASLDPYKNRIRLVQIATREHTWIIDLDYVKDPRPLYPILLDPNIVKVIQNSKFETKNFLHHWGVYPENVFDTMLASRLTRLVFQRGGNALDEIVLKYLGEEMDKSLGISDWSQELSEAQLEYAYKDAEVLLPLSDKLYAVLFSEGMLRSAKVEFDAVLPFAQMELAGLDVDLNIIQTIADRIVARKAELLPYLAEQLPSESYGLWSKNMPINYDSSDQVRAAFKKRTGVDLVPEERHLGGDETKKAGLKIDLLKHRRRFTKLVDALVDWSGLSHNLSSFCDPFLNREHEHPVTKRVHPEYKEIGQEQHRAAISNPNMNFPRPSTFGPIVDDPVFKPSYYCPVSFRQAFVCAPGTKFSIADFANNQLRIMADEPYCNEASLQEEFDLGEGADPYKRIAANGLKKPKDQVSKEERMRYKTLTLALSFIAGAGRFQATKLMNSRQFVSKEDCYAEIDAFYAALPGMRTWHETAPHIAKQCRYVESTWGRKIFFPPPPEDLRKDICTANRAVNFPICATEVDGAKLAGGRLARALIAGGYSAVPKLFVYDEWVVEVKETQAEEVHALQKKIMQESMQEVLLKVPALVDGNIGENWDAK